MRFIYQSAPCDRCRGTKRVGRGQCFRCNGSGRMRTAAGQRAFERVKLYFRQQLPFDLRTLKQYAGHGVEVET
jgi:hypothetical protein